MPPLRFATALLVLLLPIATAMAEEPCVPSGVDPIDAAETERASRDPSTAGMRAASNAAREQWEAEMTATYARLMATLPPAQRDALRASQRDWLAFQRSQGAAISAIIASQKGSMFQLMATGGGTELVKARVLQLRGFEMAAGADGPAPSR